MENNNQTNNGINNSQKYASTWLMLIGVIFVGIAGIIFVTTAWEHLPVVAKQLCMTVAAFAAFFGSYLVRKGGTLHKTETALYYLGVIFTGLAMIILSGGIYDHEYFYEINAMEFALASIVMIIPVLIRFILERRGLEIVSLYVLFETAIIFVTAQAGGTIISLINALTVWFVVLSVLTYLFNDNFDVSENFEKCMYTMYYQLAVRVSYMSLMLCGSGETTPMNATIVLGLILAGVSAIYIKTNNKKYRILQSIIIFVFVAVILNDMNISLDLDIKDGIIIFTMFTIWAAIAATTMRREMYKMCMIVGMVAPFFQIIEKTFTFSDKKVPYYPYSFILAAAVAVYGYRKSFMKSGNQLNDMGNNQTVGQAKYYIFSALQLITGMLTFWGLHDRTMLASAYFIICAIFMVSISTFLKGRGKILVCHMIALMNFLFGLAAQQLVEIPYEYGTEWFTTISGVGIVLLGFIWYDRKELIGKIQYLLTAGIFAILLIRNYSENDIFSMLYLGILSIAVLIWGVCTERKKYAKLAVISLVCMVLYETKSFWLELEWWMYLFIAGVTMIVIAIKREKDNK